MNILGIDEWEDEHYWLAWGGFLYEIDIDIDEECIPFVGCIEIPYVDWVKKYYWTVVDQIPRSHNYIENLLILIPPENQEDWNNRRGELFWKWFEDVLKLGFNYMAEYYENIGNNILDLLQLIGIDPWELLNHLLSYLNQAKTERFKSEIRNEMDDIKENLLSDLKEITFTTTNSEFLEILSSFSSDNINDELNKFSLFNTEEIFLEEDFTAEDVIEEIASVLNQFGYSLNPSSLIEMIYNLENILKDDYSSIIDEIENNLIVPSTIDVIGLEEHVSMISAVISEWEELNDVTFSDLISIYNFDILKMFPNIEEININDNAEFFLTLLFKEELMLLANDIFIDLVFFNDPFFYFRSDYQNWLILTLVALACNVVIDLIDAQEGIGYGIWDDILLGVFVFGVYEFSYMALKKATSNYDELVAEYFKGSGKNSMALLMLEIIFEFIIEIIPQLGTDTGSDKITMYFELFLCGYGAVSTFLSFESEGIFNQIKWFALDIGYSVADALFPLLVKHPVALKASCIVEIMVFIIFGIEIIY